MQLPPAGPPGTHSPGSTGPTGLLMSRNHDVKMQIRGKQLGIK
jgi:hypothetical protein